MIGSTHPLLDDFVSSLFIMPLVLWTVLVIYVFGDLFRDSEMNGAKKAWWAIAQFVLPLIGCLLYFLLNAESINRRQKRRNHPSDSHEDLPLILESMTELEIRTGEALELARATFAAQSEHSEFIAQTTRNVEAANAALKLDGEKVVRLSEAFQEVNFAMNEQSNRLSTLAQELRSNQSGLTNTTERLQQLWAASESAKDVALIQIQQSEQLKELDDTIQYLHRAFAGQSEQLDQMSQDDTHDRVIELSEQVAQLEGLLNGAASTQSNHSDALNKLNLAQQELRDC